MKIAIVSANLGNYDLVEKHVSQTIPYDYFLFTDENFPPRVKAMTPRLQSKIPKMFGWQMAPEYDYYLWIDADIALSSNKSLEYFYNNCKDYDIVTLKHPKRSNIKQEAKYLQSGLATSRYIRGRYQNELLEEQMQEIHDDKNYIDDTLVIGGVFMYKNNKRVQNTFKEWWYHTSRYHIIDQLAFTYVIRKNKLKINIRPDIYYNCPYLKYNSHRHHSR